METEVWKDYPGYEGMYQVSNWGKIKSLARRNARGALQRERIMKFGFTHGYFNVELWKNGQGITRRVNMLVAETFIGPCPDGKEVNHKDTNKTNNHIDNLEYVTHQENMKHAFQHNLRNTAQGEKHYKAKLSEKQVLEIRTIYAKGGITQEALGKQYGVCQVVIGNIVRRKIWKHI